MTRLSTTVFILCLLLAGCSAPQVDHDVIRVVAVGDHEFIKDIETPSIDVVESYDASGDHLVAVRRAAETGVDILLVGPGLHAAFLEQVDSDLMRRLLTPAVVLFLDVDAPDKIRHWPGRPWSEVDLTHSADMITSLCVEICEQGVVIRGNHVSGELDQIERYHKTIRSAVSPSDSVQVETD